MSFTQDELQAFNTILEQRLSAHRRELERTFDQRISGLKRDFEQRLDTLQRSLGRGLISRFTDQQAQIAQTLQQRHEALQQQQQAQFEDLVERALAAQLLAIEQLISQHYDEGSLHRYDESGVPLQDIQPQMIEAIEVQTEIPWDDVADMFNKALDERMAHLNASLQASVQHLEQQVLAQLRTSIQNRELSATPLPLTIKMSGDSDSETLQNLLSGIEQLERIIESMQVAMTANHAFLSNRLFHHQQLPLERAHPHQEETPPPVSPSPIYHSDLQTSQPLTREPENAK